MLESIHIKNWKKYEDFSCKFKKGINFIIGPNAIGKTSLLEAIYYAITGNVRSDVALNKVKRIGSTTSGYVNLILSHDNNIINLLRSFNGRTTHSISCAPQNYNITGRENVKRWIERLFNTKQIFLDKMFYFGEGDIFKYISKRGAQSNFRAYIEDMLGIEKLHNIRKDFNKLKGKFNKKKKSLESKIKSISEIPSQSDTSLEEQLKSLNKKMIGIKNKIDEIEKNQSKLKLDIELSKKSMKDFSVLQNDLQNLLNIDNLDFDIVEINNLIKKELVDLLKEEKRLNMEIQEQNERKIILKKNLSEISDIENSLKNLKVKFEQETILDDTSTLECPICDKPLSLSEFREIYEIKLKNRTNIENKLIKVENSLKERNVSLSKIQKNVKEKEKLQYKIEIYIPSWTIKLKQYKEREAILPEKLNENNELGLKKNELKKELSNINKNILSLTEKLAIRKAPKHYLDPSYIKNEINVSNNCNYLTDLLEESFKEMLYRVKLQYLEKITKEISRLWSIIFHDPKRSVSFDNNLNPILESEEGTIVFKNLSGGEKTILSVLTKTIFMRKFSSIKFMILDEPFEHLNLKNRVQIINYLIMYVKAKLVDQLIITTFEESLTRNLIEDPDINIISLGAYDKHKKIYSHK